MVNILFIGDIIGRPGRDAVKKLLPKIRTEEQIDFVIANGENAAGGKGITPEVVKDLFKIGIDVITGGNHTWAYRDILKIIDTEPRLLRPANFPEDIGVPGRGVGIYNLGERFKIAVINLIGRVFMKPYD
ncbi:MAG: YmdB family metallophosphoesterase, partial [Candidatus Sumerlaeia bacterium]|nr:YmdB family metallophosphoesterase [Candidatus Sumerlaeia bacterium]